MLRNVLFSALFLISAAANAIGQSNEIEFQRDIRPILSDNCFQCHGPDPEDRQADLRLDLPDVALDWAIIPGKPHDSEVIRRILSDDVDLRMPPPDSGKKLTQVQIERLRDWIDQGAQYEVHWSFAPPQRPKIPAKQHADWVRNPIDAFVADRLEREQLQPSEPADRVTWLRRLSLDLIGLPPSPAEIDAFIADRSPDAAQVQIERLLKSPHFGERWGRVWLDAARYADSDGYEKDKPREMWFYRDWVIDALNRDMPYDDFIVHQIAGDLLPDAGQEALVATGFLRNSMVNEEGGADPEQFRMEAMFDRIDAIGKSVLGLTVQCAQCHSHKYDPLTHSDYFRMFAFLNNTHDAIVPVYTPRQEHRRKEILAEIDAIESELKASTENWKSKMAKWEQTAGNSCEPCESWEVLKPTEIPFEGQKFLLLDDHSILSQSFAPKSSNLSFVFETKQQDITGIRLELLTHPLLPRRGPGRSMRGTAALSEFSVEVAPLDDPSQTTTVKIVSATADVNPPKSPQPDYLPATQAKGDDKRVVGPIDMAIDDDVTTAWTTDNDPGRRNQPRKAVFVFEQPVGFPQGTRLTLKPNMNHGGWNNNDNHNCLMGRYRFSLTTTVEPVADPLPAQVRQLLDLPRHDRSDAQQATIFRYWRTTVDEWSDANQRIEQLWQQYPEGHTQLVLEECETPRSTHVLHRGDFLSPEEQVRPGVPDFLHSLPDPADQQSERSRLTFARWLVDEKSPTTARSIVNRIWQSYFGIGLVETSDDLGSQGAPPSHPQLLDWLSVELMENDWSLKHIHRLIASSATYRQSSHVTDDLYRRDPYNRLLARGPRFRVDAEVVRDIALTASGLLSPRVGGPSVYPPAPRFLFDPPASYGPKTWNEETDSDRYRRGLYTFRFRSVPYPMLEAFDAVPGNVSCVRRNRSNTPLQALTILNEPLSMECARALASRTIESGGSSDQSRLRFAMRCCVARTPDPDEIATLQTLLDKQRDRLRRGEIRAETIVDSPEIAPQIAPQSADDDAAMSTRQIDELAAWSLVARVLLSLDETITKE